MRCIMNEELTLAEIDRLLQSLKYSKVAIEKLPLTTDDPDERQKNHEFKRAQFAEIDMLGAKLLRIRKGIV
jgi:hypothetical protein